MKLSVCEVSLMDEVRRVREQELHKARAGVDHGLWELYVEEGALKMYKMEKKVGGIPCDPTVAVHTVKVRNDNLMSPTALDNQ